MDGYWVAETYTKDGKLAYSPSGCPIVGEWREPHPAESWPQGKIVEVRSREDEYWFLRRFHSYRLEEPHFCCFRERKSQGLTWYWDFIREPE